MKKEIKNLRIGIFSPYTRMLGGGEKYIFSIASALSRENKVYIYADPQIRKKARDIFGIDLNNVNFLPLDTLNSQNPFQRYFYLSRYDLFFYMTDGSVFFSKARKNFLIIQSPLHIPQKDLLNKLKLSNWKIICYSKFMQEIIRKKMGSNRSIFSLPAYVDIPQNKVKQADKENIILSVGRFFPYPHDKKHAVLIKTFKDAYKKYFSDWKLVIAGGLTETGGKKILDNLKKLSVGLPVEILTNISSARLTMLYTKAKIYWHAAGFGENLIEYPEKAEHFGISPIEAMAYGVVPVVFNGGGLKDIIKEGCGGYFWSSEKELVDKTVDLTTGKTLLDEQSAEAYAKAKDYSYANFYENLEKIIAG